MTDTATEDRQATARALSKIDDGTVGLDLQTLGMMLVKSNYFGDTRDQSQAIVKVLAGRELGFGPIASMQGVYIVKGKVTLSSNLVAAAIQKSGRYRYRVISIDNDGCTIEFYENTGSGWVALGESSFTQKDAETAGLKDGNYKTFPRNMYFARALTNGARWYTPEVFNGPIYTPDELGARVDGEGQVIELPEPDPQPAKAYVILSADNEVWKGWLELHGIALGLGISVPDIRLPIARDELMEHGRNVKEVILERRRELARIDADRLAASPAAESEAPDEEPSHPSSGVSSELADALERNGNLLDNAKSLRIAGLGPFRAAATWPLDKIEEANGELASRITSRNVDLDAQIVAQGQGAF